MFASFMFEQMTMRLWNTISDCVKLKYISQTDLLQSLMDIISYEDRDLPSTQ